MTDRIDFISFKDPAYQLGLRVAAAAIQALAEEAVAGRATVDAKTCLDMVAGLLADSTLSNTITPAEMQARHSELMALALAKPPTDRAGMTSIDYRLRQQIEDDNEDE